ncbi:hypothetical protein HYS28_03920 [Candidatus Uhrbacteria bacterium]|nr:hypothetical protein [Candidatus Uhrbacteria bacterium]
MKHRNFTRSFQAHAYSGRKLRNPFFSHEPRRIPRGIVLAVFLAIVVGAGSLFLFAPFLAYRDVRIDGLTTLSVDDVRATVETTLDKRRLLVIPGRHLVFAHRGRIEHDLQAAYNFASLTLRREGRTLVIDAKERITQVAWISAGATSLVDLTGIAVSEASEEAKAQITARVANAADVPFAPGLQPTMPIIENLKGETVTLGQPVLSSLMLERILTLDAALRDRELVPLRYTVEEASSPWTTAETSDTAILVDLTLDLTETLAMFDAFRHGSEQPLASLEYVDLRFGNHVYIKSR